MVATRMMQRMVMTVVYCCALILVATLQLAMASDADPINDYCVADLASTFKLNGLPCKNPANLMGEDFAFRLFEKAGNVSASPIGVTITPGFAGINYPALNTLGLALARIDVAPYALVPPHTHPRATESFYVLTGSFFVGFVDTNGKLFSAYLGKGDVFVFPKGLLHFQLSTCKVEVSTAIATLNAQNPGTQLIAPALFGSHIPDYVLEKAFGIDEKTVHKIQGIFTH